MGFNPRDPAFFWLRVREVVAFSPHLPCLPAAGVLLHGHPSQDLMALGLAADYFTPNRLLN
jgi:hypothetical protein